MKKILVAIIGLFFSLQLFAQPAYDNCPAYDLGTAPFCDETVFFNNIGATTSDIGSFNIPPCFKNKDLSRDVWISFVASDTILDYVITVTGKKDGATKAMLYPEIALYRGDCLFDELAIVLCASYNPTVNDTTVVLNAFGLTPGATYFMRIHDNKGDNTDNSGSFVLCVKQKDPVIKITNGFSNACSGKLTDTGGDAGDYSSNEDFFYKICPAGFSQCIKFALDYYNIDNAGDYIKIYDSDMKDNSKLLANLTGANGGSGGVAFQVYASSGCVSIEFHSDAAVEEDGFLASWQCTAAACDPPTPITIVPTATDAQIIAAVSTPQTVVSVDTIICGPTSYGTFSATDNSLLGLKKGFLLTTGSATNAIGPNNSTSTTTSVGSLGDADLDYLSVQQGSGTLSHDACILELNVFAATDELSFEYIFGSEEYPEYVGSGFNDIFAFLVKGPGVVGDPNIGNQKNIAILPDNTTFVQINSVNDKTNWEFYRDNIGSPSIQYDGLTSDKKGIKKSLTARQKVIPCNTYHLKLAVADRGDYSFDSGVFIADIKGGAVNFDVVYNSGIDYMIENCTGTDNVTIKLSNILDYAVSYNVVITGTAINGVDYTTTIPASVTFAPGETEKTFTITPIADAIPEGVETVIITLTNNFGCGTVAYTTTKLEIHDQPYADILTGLDTVLYCKNGKINLSVKGCQTYFWQPISIMDNFESPNPVATPTGNGYIYVTGQVGTCVAKDSIYAKEIDPKINILTMDDVKICQGAKVQLDSKNNTGNQGFNWYPPLGLSNTKITNPIASPLVTTQYFAQINLSGCIVKDSITVFVDPFSFPVIYNDTVKLCQTYPVKLASDIFFSGTNFKWTPSLYLNDPTLSGPIATPDKDITYTLIATSQNGYCSDTAKVYVDVIEANVNILDKNGIEKDSFMLCKGDSMELKTFIFPAGSQIKWHATKDIISNPSSGNIIIKPTSSQWYISQLTTSQCVVYDSVFVQVDSLPLNVKINPSDTTVCQGAIVVLKSPTYEQSHFPNLYFNWEPTYDAQTPDSLYNLVIQANGTQTYKRFSYSGACVNITTSQVNVIPTNYINVSPQNSLICPGDTVTLNASANGVTSFTWSPSSGLSCTSCSSTVVTASSTTSYDVKAEFMGCPVKGSATINVSSLPTVTFPSYYIICKGSSITLNQSVDNTYTYVWTSTDPTFGVSNEGAPTVSPLGSASYFVTVTNSLGCTSKYQFDLFIPPTPVITVSSDVTICEGTPITLTATVSNTDGTFTWSDGQQGPSITVNPGVTTDYSVKFVDKYNCGSDSGSVKITVESVPDVSIQVTPDSLNISQGNKVLLEAILSKPGTNLTYNWFYQNGPLDLHTKSIEVTPFESVSVYSIEVSSPNGCKKTSEVVFNVTPPIYLVPDAFTPNGDGKNDIFKLFTKGENLTIKEFKVYSRWGQLVFEDSTNKGWDGNKGDKPAPSDVYVYWIVLDTPKGEVILKGDVTLIR